MKLEKAIDAIQTKLQNDFGVPDKNGKRIDIGRKTHEFSPFEMQIYARLTLALSGLKEAVKLTNEEII